MSICTYSDVFEFVGASSDVQTTQQTAITNLIANVTDEVERRLGRKITSTSFADVLLNDGQNCSICGDKIYLNGPYRDVYSITSVTELGVALSALTDYTQTNRYYLDTRNGVLVRNSVFWTLTPFAIKISGSMCLGGASGSGDIKQAVIELVAAKSGLWKQNVITEGGTIQSIRNTPSRETVAALDKYILRETI